MATLETLPWAPLTTKVVLTKEADAWLAREDVTQGVYLTPVPPHVSEKEFKVPIDRKNFSSGRTYGRNNAASQPLPYAYDPEKGERFVISCYFDFRVGQADQRRHGPGCVMRSRRLARLFSEAIIRECEKQHSSRECEKQHSSISELEISRYELKLTLCTKEQAEGRDILCQFDNFAVTLLKIDASVKCVFRRPLQTCKELEKTPFNLFRQLWLEVSRAPEKGSSYFVIDLSTRKKAEEETKKIQKR